MHACYVIVVVRSKDEYVMFIYLSGTDMAYLNICQGLIPALKELMPGAHHRNCVVHIWKNFIKQFKEADLRTMVFQCSRSTTEAEFKTNMIRLKAINEKAWSYLNNIEPSAWVKAYFSHWPKVDNITNNNCEIWNAKIVKHRDKPILTMLESLRCYCMTRMAGHKRVLGSYKDILPPVQRKRMEQLKMGSMFWTAIFNGDPSNETFEVHKQNSKVGVSLTHQTCTCQVWQLTGMPCEHAIACIAHKHEKPESYVHQWLTMEALNATYEHYIQPVNSEEYWAVSEHPKPEPPPLKRPIGRPKKHRRKDAVSEEVPGGKKLKKRYRPTCTKCLQPGHYEKTCKGPAKPGYVKRKAAKKVRVAKQPTQDEVSLTPSQPQVVTQVLISTISRVPAAIILVY